VEKRVVQVDGFGLFVIALSSSKFERLAGAFGLCKLDGQSPISVVVPPKGRGRWLHGLEEISALVGWTPKADEWCVWTRCRRGHDPQGSGGVLA